MRVLMINVVCGIRSTGRICTDLAVELESKGHEVKIAYGREFVPKEFERFAVRIGTDIDVKLHGVKSRLLDGCGFGSKKATIEFVNWIREYDPDVIHLHNLHGYYINVSILFEYLRKCGKRIIWTMHDCWAFTGHSAYCEAANCKKWKTGCFDCPNMREYPSSFVDRSKENWKRKKALFTGVPNMTIVTPSEWLAGLVKGSYLKEYSVKVINNGIDTALFCPLQNDLKKSKGIEDKKLVVVNSNTWRQKPDIAYYEEVAEKLGEEYSFMIYGLSAEHAKALPKQLIGVESTTSKKEFDYYMSSADLIIDSSNSGITQTVGNTNNESKSLYIDIKDFTVFQLVNSIEERASNLSRDESIDNSNNQNGYWKMKERFGIIGKYVVLGVAAIWDSRKGLKDFLELAKQLDEEHKIILVGLNEEQIKNLPDNIIGLGRTNSPQELAALYSIADVYVNPTYEDNYPTTNLEAISCGTPTITYDTGGSPESAVLYGTYVEKGDIEKIKTLLEFPNGFYNCGANLSKKYATEKYGAFYCG